LGFEPSGPPESEPEHPVYEPGRRPSARPPLVRLALVFYGALLLAALAWGALSGRPLAWTSGADSGAPSAASGAVSPLRAALAGVLAAAVVVLASHLLTQRTRIGEQLARSLATALGPLTLAECWLLAAVSGIAEEAFFRGALQPQVGLLAASLLFAAAHFVPRRELLPWTGFALAAGLLLGWLFDATGSLIAPIVAHAGINGVNLRLLTQRGLR
jgi:membrane protease YdiL (CAAX protease family)